MTINCKVHNLTESFLKFEITKALSHSSSINNTTELMKLTDLVFETFQMGLYRGVPCHSKSYKELYKDGYFILVQPFTGYFEIYKKL